MTYPPIGSVSSGTMRDEDLIPVFLDILRDYDPERAAGIQLEYADVLADDEPDDELASHCTAALFDALEEIAAPYCTFGAHPGDGADYGFWPADPDELAEDARAGILLEYHPEHESGQLARVLPRLRYEHEPIPELAYHVDERGSVTLYRVTFTVEAVWSVV